MRRRTEEGGGRGGGRRKEVVEKEGGGGGGRRRKEEERGWPESVERTIIARYSVHREPAAAPKPLPTCGGFREGRPNLTEYGRAGADEWATRRGRPCGWCRYLRMRERRRPWGWCRYVCVRGRGRPWGRCRNVRACARCEHAAQVCLLVYACGKTPTHLRHHIRCRLDR